MMSMNIIPSELTEKMTDFEANEIAERFDYFMEKLPYPGSFITKHV